MVPTFTSNKAVYLFLIIKGKDTTSIKTIKGLNICIDIIEGRPCDWSMGQSDIR
jgi:hypothetical protein